MILGAGTLALTSFTTVYVGLAALAPALRDAYGLSLDQTGVVLAAVGIGMLLTLLPWGHVADRVGERAVIAVGLGGAAVSLALAGETTSYAGLVGWLVVAGALGASVNAASGRAVMGWFEAQERGFALGVRQAAVPIGGGLAALTLPWIAAAHGTRGAFFAVAAACAVGAVVAVLGVREAPARPAAPHVGELRGTHRDARVWLLAGGSSLYLCSQIAVTGFVVLFLHEHRGMSATAAAGVLAATNLLGIGARIGAGRWSDRLHARVAPLRRLGILLTLTTALVAVLVNAPLWLLVPMLVVCGVVSMAWNGLSFTAAAEAAGHARSGAAMGLQQTVLGVVSAGFPPLFAWVVGATSWQTAFALATLGPLAGALALRRVPEPNAGARSPGMSAIPPAAP